MRIRARFLAISMLMAGAAIVCAIGGVDKPPPPAAPRLTHFAKPAETRLENGLRIIVAERPALPLVAVQLLVRSGAESDPANRGGLASLTGALLTKGTGTMSAPEIATAIESLGGTISSGAGWDYSSAAVVVTSDKLSLAVDILADIALRPSFKAEEIERLRKQYLDRLQIALQQPGNLVSYVATRVLYPTGEYAHPAGGTVETLRTITRDDIVRFHAGNYRPDKAILIFVGDITMEKAKACAQRFWPDWKMSPKVEATPSPPKSPPWKPQNIVVNMPQAGQAAVDIFKPAIRRDSPDYYAGIIANAALGRGLGSRLNRDIRIKRGLSYGASSSLDMRRDAGTFAAGAQTKNESAAEVAKLLVAETQEMTSDPVQGDELKSRQAMLTGGYARAMETNFGMLGEISGLVIHDVGLDELDKFLPSVNAVTTEDVKKFSEKYLTTPSAVIIAGKAEAFIEPLKKAAPDTRVIEQNELDVNRAELVKTK